MVFCLMAGWSQVALAGPPQLTVSGNRLVDPQGRTVILRGVSSMGMGMVYGDKANPGTYVPLTLAQYVDRSIQTDVTGNKWYSNAIRLAFERFPSVNPARLYSTENRPYAMPDTVAFTPWQSNRAYADGDVASWNGSRYRVLSKQWRADRGQPWNPTRYQVGDVVVTVPGNVYRCTSSTGTGTPAGDWTRYPQGTGPAIPESQGSLQYVWQYLGPFGQSGSVAPFSGITVLDNNQQFFIDNLVQWQYMSADYTPAQALANFADWKSKVMDPAVQRAIDDGLYVVITDFDFGPAHHPLRRARMLDFWTRMAASQWANHPQVIFELWNESEDISTYAGGPGSWSAQKPAIQETINAVRAAAANNIILVPTPFYSSWIGEATANPLTGVNLAYTLHQYRSQWEAYSANRAQITQGLASGQAIVVTEWGDDTSETNPALMWPNATTAPPALRQLLEPSDGSTNPAAGSFAWALTQTWGPDLYSDAALTNPTPFGVATRQWLLAKRFDSQPVPSTALPPSAPTGLLVVGGGRPDSVAASAGTPQSAAINTTLAAALKATVRDATLNPVSGVTVTFTVPASGARATFGIASTATAVTDASGVATAPTLTANAVAGAYTISATVPGVAAAANFSLTNTSGSGGAVGVWTNVTPAGVDLTNALDCGNFGSISMVADPARPSNLYTQFNCQGVWRSTDYGQTWTGPINTGTGGTGVKGAGGLAIAAGPVGQPPILYSAGIRGTGMGFWKSTDGGVSWTTYNVAPGGSRQDFYPPVVDPYNPDHVLMNGHEMNLLVQSVNGGQTWTSVPMASGMNQSGTGFVVFVNTGNAATTANTWLWIGQSNVGLVGTWRTADGGSSWTQVDKNEHPHGETQFYQPDTTGVIYMAGVYSLSGWGVLRSTDYGQTWAHVGNMVNEAVVFGTPNKVYAMWAWACGYCTIDPAIEVAPASGINGWVSAPTPANMSAGAAQAAVVFDGTRYVIVTANWLSGLWRYVE